MHEQYMAEAIRLARKSLGFASPNPAVGAVVVKDGTVVGQGHTAPFGGPHAEVVALREAGEAAAGATVYVTLEPCCHFGKTPPCTDAIIAARVAAVVYALEDPDPLVAGKGAAALRRAGIAVHEGPLSAEAAQLNEAYIKHRRVGLPFVTYKVAISLDGKTATRTGDSKWLTGPEARAWVHQRRTEVDCVMVGVGTVLRDDPLLTARPPEGAQRDPAAVIVDSRARTPLTAQVLRANRRAPTVIATTAAAPADRCEAFEAAGATVVRCEAAGERVDVRDLARRLAEMGKLSVLCEGGATLAGSLIQAGLVDKVAVFVAPVIVGGRAAPSAIGGLGFERIADALHVSDLRTSRLGSDVLLEGYVCSRGS
jgi:diaminohydroxyphosphoribosylaminopyrimidine deaminase/5-amino-6-(5-phosphoribosylamino)uracil reductase